MTPAAQTTLLAIHRAGGRFPRYLYSADGSHRANHAPGHFDGSIHALVKAGLVIVEGGAELLTESGAKAARNLEKVAAMKAAGTPAAKWAAIRT